MPIRNHARPFRSPTLLGWDSLNSCGIKQDVHCRYVVWLLFVGTSHMLRMWCGGAHSLDRTQDKPSNRVVAIVLISYPPSFSM